MVDVKILKMYDDNDYIDWSHNSPDEIEIYAYLTPEYLKNYKRLYGNISDTNIELQQNNKIYIPTGINIEIPKEYTIQFLNRIKSLTYIDIDIINNELHVSYINNLIPHIKLNINMYLVVYT